MNEQLGKTCATCKHWIKLPLDPGNIREVKGECREGPPHATSLPQNGNLIVIASYPKLQPDFPACGRHQVSINGDAC